MYMPPASPLLEAHPPQYLLTPLLLLPLQKRLVQLLLRRPLLLHLLHLVLAQLLPLPVVRRQPVLRPLAVRALRHLRRAEQLARRQAALLELLNAFLLLGGLGGGLLRCLGFSGGAFGLAGSDELFGGDELDEGFAV